MIQITPQMRILVAVQPVDFRNYSAPLIIPSSDGKNPKTKAFPAVGDVATRNNQRP
jgi:hypothetical protein